MDANEIKTFEGTRGGEVSGGGIDIFLLDQLIDAGAIRATDRLNQLFRLNLGAIRGGAEAGYFVDTVPEICRGPAAPAWCKAAVMGLVPGRRLAVEGIYANGHIEDRARDVLRGLAETSHFGATLPSLIRCLGEGAAVTPKEAITELDGIYRATHPAAIPLPGSEFERFCRENPSHPVCLVAAAPPTTRRARALCAELLSLASLYDLELIDERQMAAIYRASYPMLASWRVGADLTHLAASTLVDGVALEPKAKATLLFDVVSGKGTVGLYGPDSPWAEICRSKNPPKICQTIDGLPLAASLTSALVQRGVWEIDHAVRAWGRLNGQLPRVARMMPRRPATEVRVGVS